MNWPAAPIKSPAVEPGLTCLMLNPELLWLRSLLFCLFLFFCRFLLSLLFLLGSLLLRLGLLVGSLLLRLFFFLGFSRLASILREGSPFGSVGYPAFMDEYVFAR